MKKFYFTLHLFSQNSLLLIIFCKFGSEIIEIYNYVAIFSRLDLFEISSKHKKQKFILSSSLYIFTQNRLIFASIFMISG